MADGWIKIHRSLLEWEWWSDINTRCLWLTILLLANHDTKRWQGHDINAGQFITSLDSLAAKSGLSVRSVRTALGKLKSTGEIDIKATNKFTLITVIKWADYQVMDLQATSNRQTNDKQTTNERQTNDNQTTTNKNIKNVNNNKNERNTVDYGAVIDLYHEKCPSLPTVKKLSEERKKSIKARLRTYSMDDLKLLFEKAEASDFLKGNNNRNWTADFDWLLKDSNIPKVLEGKYDNKREKESGWSFTDLI